MYKHNPLPQNISKLSQNIPVRRRNIVFSSPKFSLFHETISRQKLAKSQSKQKSFHRINSKEKPIVMTPSRKRHNFEMSTNADNKTALEVDYLIQPKILDETRQSTYFSINTLLNSKQKTDKLINDFLILSRKSPCQQQSIKRVENDNCLQQNIWANIDRIKPQQNGFNLTLLIEQNLWSSYEGEINLDDGTFDGYGSLILANGDKFMGFFVKSKAEGHGTYYKGIDDQAFCGVWSQGLLSEIL